MGEPGIGKLGGSTGMALAAGLQQVGFNLQTFFRIFRAADIVDAVTIEAHRLVRLLIGVLLPEQRHRGSVEVGDIGSEHVGGDAVLIHDLRIGMAIGAYLRRFEPEGSRGGIFDAVHPMAVDTGGNIRIALTDQGRTVNAV